MRSDLAGVNCTTNRLHSLACFWFWFWLGIRIWSWQQDGAGGVQLGQATIYIWHWSNMPGQAQFHGQVKSSQVFNVPVYDRSREKQFTAGWHHHVTNCPGRKTRNPIPLHPAPPVCCEINENVKCALPLLKVKSEKFRLKIKLAAISERLRVPRLMNNS